MNSDKSLFDQVQQLPIVYTVCECIVAVAAFIGNLLVIIVFLQDKRLRKVTNFYIVSLAAADLLVGLVGVPSAILTRMGLPRDAFNGCLTMLSLLMVFCTISILNLVAVSVDRFWAILFPLNYHSKMSSSAAGLIIVACWIIGALIGFLPLFGINKGPLNSGECLFLGIISYDYLVFLYFATIVFPGIILALFYGRIYMVVIGQGRPSSTFSSFQDGVGGLRRSRTFPVPLLKKKRRKKHRVKFDGDEHREFSRTSSSSEDRDLTPSPDEPVRTFKEEDVKPIRWSYSRREVKKAQKLSIIVLFFMICWVPLYTNNTIEAFWHDYRCPAWLLDTLIILSHLNSAVNPLLYAYHMKDFREALRRLLCDCVLRQQDLRDIRRRELVSLAQINVRRNLGANGRSDTLLSATYSCPNSLLNTPELSPSISVNTNVPVILRNSHNLCFEAINCQ